MPTERGDVQIVHHGEAELKHWKPPSLSSNGDNEEACSEEKAEGVADDRLIKGSVWV